MPVQANNKFQQIAYQPGKIRWRNIHAGGGAERKKKRRRGGGSSSAAPAANPAYKEQMDKWQSNLNSLQKPSMEKAHLHGQLRGQDCGHGAGGDACIQQQIPAAD